VKFDDIPVMQCSERFWIDPGKGAIRHHVEPVEAKQGIAVDHKKPDTDKADIPENLLFFVGMEHEQLFQKKDGGSLPNSMAGNKPKLSSMSTTKRI
jgi:hypothetical protein